MSIDAITNHRWGWGMPLAAVVMLLVMGVSSATAAVPAPGWTINSVAEPTDFSSLHNAACENEPGNEEGGQGPCDHYRLFAQNVGAASSSGTVTIVDTLPSHLQVIRVVGEENQAGASAPLTCEKLPEPHCTYASAVPPGGFFTMQVMVAVEAGAEPVVTNQATIEGGGAPTVATSAPGTVANAIDGTSIPFSFTSFAFGVDGADGIADAQAGDHPSSVTVGFGVSTLTRLEHELGNGEKAIYEHDPVQDGAKNLTVDLPPGFVGNPQTASQCTSTQLTDLACPPTSMVGTAVFEESGTFKFTGEESLVSAGVYNMVPEAGYPAEFGFTFIKKGITIYVNVAHTSKGYVLRAFSPGIVNAELGQVSLTFFGNPGEHDGGSPSSGAFLTNPTDCSPGNGEATVRADSWEEPDGWISSKAVVYPHVTGCDALRFEPTISVDPEVEQADGPSGYEVDVKVPQAQQNYAPVLATPDLKDATVTLPAGVSISPSAADGLVGCRETGAEGIDIPSGERLPDEAGEGEEVGVDGLAHLSGGHCPPASQIGTVEVETPLLPAHTLGGSLYLAQPKCGGAGQSPCTEASATNGELYGLYLEIVGDGVVVKLKGKVEADPTSGRLTARFEENPQIPFSELRLKIDGGQRAPLANPQSCGTFTTTSDLRPWSSPQTPDGTPSGSFVIGGCSNGSFAPGFSAGTITPSAGAFSPFTLTFSRKDGEQDLAGLTVTTPPGLLGVLKSVVQCPEPQAGKGECGPQSLIGHTEVAAGAGSHPYWVPGSVFLTGPYGGGPFGLSIVTPAVAGPFNLGNVIVRGAIHVNPNTSALTVVSDPLPQIIDGAPLRIKTVSVTIDRPGFMFNPTNCSQQAIVGTVSSAQGSATNVSSSFAAANCAALPFKPSFKASTQAKTSKADGASLAVKVGSSAGQANIAKVRVILPKQLPARLTTLQKACTEAQFNTNPAGCPPGSAVGSATAVTPVLAHALTGPAYLVSHGGAAFPDLVFVLQGEGIVLYLDGNTNIKKGITSSTFNSVPDAPISTFETVFPEGPHSVLATNIPAKTKGSMCAQKLTMPTAITGQNGAVVKQTTKIAVTSCLKAKKKKAKRAATRGQGGPGRKR
jgi:hypothetical protein